MKAILESATPGKKMTPKKQSIMDAAIELMAEKGYDGASTSEIAQKAGVSEASIFKHFKTKKNLFRELAFPVALRIMVPVSISNVKGLVSVEYDSFEKLVQALFQERIAFAKKHRAMIKIIIQEIFLHDELKSIIRKNFITQIYPILTATIVKFQKEKKLRKIPPKVVIRSMVSLAVSYIITKVILFPDLDWDDETEIEESIQLLMEGVAINKKGKAK